MTPSLPLVFTDPGPGVNSQRERERENPTTSPHRKSVSIPPPLIFALLQPNLSIFIRLAPKKTPVSIYIYIYIFSFLHYGDTQTDETR
jgi:hypothetical protein